MRLASRRGRLPRVLQRRRDPPQGCVAAIAAIAQRTERIRLGPCVAPMYMREPTYIARATQKVTARPFFPPDGKVQPCLASIE
jgi:hypothetical protein